jgi:hypothetical protein
MRRLIGSKLDLDVDEVFGRDDRRPVFAAHDVLGQRWLVAEVGRSPAGVKWLCAPQSSKAIECVRSGRADVRDALRHSADGAVVLVTQTDAEAVADLLLRCADVGEDLLSPYGSGVPSRDAESAV